MSLSARQWLDRIRALPVPEGGVRVMNVCGGHERTITQSGLRHALPEGIELIAGPGCPVCVCPEEDIHHALRLALDQGVILAAFGDLLRVPVNVVKGEPRSLLEARAWGAEVRAVAAPQEVSALAQAHPGRQVVFLAAGFETTTAPIAAWLAAGGLPDNLTVLLAARRTWPAVAWLLHGGPPGFDALIAPGHVAAVMGAEEWRFVAEQYGLPVAVAGFTAEGILAALHAVLLQRTEGRARLENLYPEVVRPQGNPIARRLLDDGLLTEDAPWRGIGVIPRSGFALPPSWAEFDARRRFPAPAVPRRRAGAMPPGCACAEVVLGRTRPQGCPLYGAACTPKTPVGPCMVSDEGACHIAWAGGVRRAA
ncbi:MAG: hydrogenase formation protein HypD [Pseudomonadota bacterium]|jgi:hydrogenase expression/formation protein HypD